MYQKVNDEESAENLLEKKSNTRSPPQLYSQRLIGNIDPRKWNITANPISTIITVLLCVSVFLNIFAWIQRTPQPIVHEVQYGEDFRYMSLDHNYDHLWNRVSSDHGGLIKFPDPNDPRPDGDAAIGIMSMLVFPLYLALQND